MCWRDSSTSICPMGARASGGSCWRATPPSSPAAASTPISIPPTRVANSFSASRRTIAETQGTGANPSCFIRQEETMRDAKTGVPGALGVGRREFLQGVSAATLIGAGLLPGRRTLAATQASWVGWQGYDDPLKAGTFLADNGIELVTSYINSNEEIITKLQAGGVGQTDLVTIYYGHIPLLVAADLAEPIDEGRVPGISDIFPEFLNVDVLRHDGKLYAVPFTWGTLSMIYDPAAIPAPTSWKDCLKDEVKGKVAMVDDMTGLLATWAPIAVGTKTPTRLKIGRAHV